MWKYLLLFLLFLCGYSGGGTLNTALANDAAKNNINLVDLQTVKNSFQIARSTFLPDYSENLGFSDYNKINDDHNTINCTDYPLSSCPTGGRCEYCPFNSKKYKVLSCLPPYILSDKTCSCPPSVSMTNPNDVCVKYCGNVCIQKTCTPTADKTTCTNGFKSCANGCGQNTRKCCVACEHKITTKPANSSYTYCNCTDDNGTKQIQCGCVCNSGYHIKNGTCENGGTCEKDCIANNCSGYTLSTCPPNGNCSKCTITATNCSTDGTKYKLDSCASGYVVSGNVCRPQTCDEKGMKDCNGSCIAKTECCGGCASGQTCQNGSCVQNDPCPSQAKSLQAQIDGFNEMVSDPHHIEFCNAGCKNCGDYPMIMGCESRRTSLLEQQRKHNSNCPNNQVSGLVGWCKGIGLCGGSGPGYCMLCHQ